MTGAVRGEGMWYVEVAVLVIWRDGEAGWGLCGKLAELVKLRHRGGGQVQLRYDGGYHGVAGCLLMFWFLMDC